MPYNIRTDKYIHDIKYKWYITSDAKDNEFKPLVDNISNSNQSCFIDGSAGVGKSTLINMIKQNIRDINKEEDEESEKEETVTIMRIKQQYEAIKNKMLTTTERLKTKLSKTRKEEAEQRIKFFMKSWRNYRKNCHNKKQQRLKQIILNHMYHLHQQTSRHLLLME